MFEYCDFIADKIRNLFVEETNEIVAAVGKVQMDLHPQEGYYVSSKKTIIITDCNLNKMRVTIEMIKE